MRNFSRYNCPTPSPRAGFLRLLPLSITIQHDVSLRGLNTFGIEARAARLARVTSIESLRELQASKDWSAGPRLILGGGSNIVFAGDFEGLVVRLAMSGRSLLDSDGTAWRLRLAAGEPWHAAVMWTLAQGWPGLENLALIPGTCGAAPIQNIGAYGIELAERFESLEAMEVDSGRLVTLDRDACAFAYRDSLFKGRGRDQYVITAITLRLPRPWQPRLDYGDVRSMLARQNILAPSAPDVAHTIIQIRQDKLPDPAQLGNAGSFFKNPVVDANTCARLREQEPGLVAHAQTDGSFKLAAGWLIDRCGWKGRRWGVEGRAAVHERQALVLVNRGGASGAELLALAAAIVADVAARFGVELEIEPTVVGSEGA